MSEDKQADHLSTDAMGAIEAAFLEGRGQMVGRARKLLREAEVPESVTSAEDIVQEAFLEAVKRAEVLRNPRAYLFKVINTSVSRRVGLLARQRESTALVLSDRADRYNDFAESSVRRLTVADAVDQLPVAQRRAFHANKVMGFSQKETAYLLGKQPGTIGAQVAKAVAALTALVSAAVCGWWVAEWLVGEKLANTSPPEASSTADMAWRVVRFAVSTGALYLSVLRRGWRWGVEYVTGSRVRATSRRAGLPDH
ncbi:RNA polymerase sigma factor [Streptomyces sp. NPDC059943]|uniref:RNA polymerase sigma factor n=1 Tax=Streptomyces sp. NPDC059943 TaxID=3347010 RepID=UPI00365F6C0B